jgi:hypothetical protein
MPLATNLSPASNGASSTLVPLKLPTTQYTNLLQPSFSGPIGNAFFELSQTRTVNSLAHLATGYNQEDIFDENGMLALIIATSFYIDSTMTSISNMSSSILDSSTDAPLHGRPMIIVYLSIFRKPAETAGLLQHPPPFRLIQNDPPHRYYL